MLADTLADLNKLGLPVGLSDPPQLGEAPVGLGFGLGFRRRCRDHRLR